METTHYAVIYSQFDCILLILILFVKGILKKLELLLKINEKQGFEILQKSVIFDTLIVFLELPYHIFQPFRNLLVVATGHNRLHFSNFQQPGLNFLKVVFNLIEEQILGFTKLLKGEELLLGRLVTDREVV